MKRKYLLLSGITIGALALLCWASSIRWNELASEQQKTGRTEALVQLEQQLLASNESDNEKQLAQLSRLCLASWQLGHFATAENAMRSALSIAQNKWGKTDPRCAVYLANLATVCRDAGKFDQAKEAAKLALEVDVHAFGEDSAYAARDYGNAAILWQLAAFSQSDPAEKQHLLSESRFFDKRSLDIRDRLRQQQQSTQ